MVSNDQTNHNNFYSYSCGDNQDFDDFYYQNMINDDIDTQYFINDGFFNDQFNLQSNYDNNSMVL